MVIKISKYKFPVVIEKDENGFYVYCPTLQGCYTEGDTFEEAIKNIIDAIRLHIMDRLERKEEIPEPEMINLTMVEVNIRQTNYHESSLKIKFNCLFDEFHEVT